MIKLLIESTVALLFDVVFILIAFRKIGVTIPLSRYMDSINTNPITDEFIPNKINEITIADEKYINNIEFCFLSNLYELNEVSPAEKLSPAQSIPK